MKRVTIIAQRLPIVASIRLLAHCAADAQSAAQLFSVHRTKKMRYDAKP